MVVAIIAVLAGMILPNFKHAYDRQLTRNAVNELAYIMQYAQSQAVIQKKKFRLEFDDAYRSYHLTKQQPVAGSQQFDKISGRLGRTFYISGQLTVKSAAAQVHFYPNGTIDKEQIELCGQGECFTVSTKEQRGFVHVYPSRS